MEEEGRMERGIQGEEKLPAANHSTHPGAGQTMRCPHTQPCTGEEGGEGGLGWHRHNRDPYTHIASTAPVTKPG